MNDLSLTYSFSGQEIKALFTQIREKNGSVPSELFNFVNAVRNTVYSRMSIDEIEEFLKK